MTRRARLNRHIALVGGARAAKTALGMQLAGRLGRPLVDLDAEPVAEPPPPRRGFADLFRREDAQTGGPVDVEQVLAVLRGATPAIVSLPDRTHAVPDVADALRARALTVDPSPAAELPADLRTRDGDDVILAALGIRIEAGVRPERGTLVADELVLQLHPLELDAVHTVHAKTLADAERLWRELEADDGPIVAYGGATTTDLVGFVASTYRGGVPWVAVPTTLVAQIDAAIGGSASIDLPEGKSLVASLHYPEEVLIDPGRLATLSDDERRSGLAAAVKLGLLAERAFWELPQEQLVRACAAFKASLCLHDPDGGGRRDLLDLGRPFAHALETASLYTLRHGDALALGLLAALRLSGRATDAVDAVLDPRPVRVDPERAWEALRRERRAPDGSFRLVLFPGGEARADIEVPEPDARAALEALIAK